MPTPVVQPLLKGYNYDAMVLLNLTVLDDRLAVCRLDPQAEIPAWAAGQPFCSITRTADELSVICPESRVPANVDCERGWRALKIEGPFDFDAVGILAAIVHPLAEAGIPILTIATYETDYVLVKEAQLERAVATLSERGHCIRRLFDGLSDLDYNDVV